MTELLSPILKIDNELMLRQLQLDDARQLFELIDKNRNYLSEFLPWPNQTKTEADSRFFINSTIEERTNGATLGYGIIYKKQLVGHISLMHMNDGKVPEIGYWIASDFSSKGITTRSTQRLTDSALNTLNIPKLTIRADVRNLGSNKVAEKSGYIFINEESIDNNNTNIWCIEQPQRVERKVAKLIIADADNKFLLMHRSDHPTFGRDPDLPGGTLELGETLLETMLREVDEEVGVKINKNNVKMVYSGLNYSKHGTHYALFVTKLKYRPDIVMSWEHSSYEWLDRDEFLVKAKNANDTYMQMVFDILKNEI